MHAATFHFSVVHKYIMFRLEVMSRLEKSRLEIFRLEISRLGMFRLEMSRLEMLRLKIDFFHIYTGQLSSILALSGSLEFITLSIPFLADEEADKQTLISG